MEEKISKLKELFEAKDDDTALALIDDIGKDQIRINPNQRADLLLIEGSIHSRRENWDKAVDAFRTLYNEGFRKNVSKNQTIALHKLGEIYCAQGQHELGIAQYRKALRILNSKMENYFTCLSRNYIGQGKCYLESNKLNDAEIYLRLAGTYATVAENITERARTYERLGLLRKKCGQREEMSKALQEAMASYELIDDRASWERCRKELELDLESEESDGSERDVSGYEFQW